MNIDYAPYCRTELEYNDKPNNSQPQIVIQNIINEPNKKTCNTTFIETHSPKSKTITLILCILFGYFGIHCFYSGKIGIGILYVFTCGLFFIGWIYDIVKIISGKYKDNKGLLIDKG